MDQFLIGFPLTLVWQSWAEAGVALVALGWCLFHLRGGVWVFAATLGALAFVASSGVIALAYTLVWRGVSAQLYFWINEHYTPLNWVRLAGLAVLLLGLTFLRRTAARTIRTDTV